ncbi:MULTISPECIES: SusC/RagA family TonB-linked outer membrane protein [Sphingobacterium]|uniref:SusC/RagA family TonB-linked outer membrane protein n=1 Tax=Sphingobacterium TaxID=28453 RepID=UPI00257FF112|nr:MULTISPECIES: SusC/RagA family TonB-linked outer membrane protein [Sphingobacterium]
MMKISIYFILFFLFSSQNLIGQEIRGIVKNAETGAALTGVSIINSLKNRSTVSGITGAFSIRDIQLPDSLTFSFIGFETQKVSVNNFQDQLIVNLYPRTNVLEEIAVINTGYQKIKPNEMTGAVQVLTQKDLQQQVGTNILERLNGIAPGVRFDNQPTAATQQKLNVSIRGLSSINGQLDPLIVLDGFIYEGDITNIDPNSIENVSILKDAAATSIWGARAGNGVIVLTTNKGRESIRLRINASLGTIVQQKPDLKKVFQLPSADYIEIERMLYEKGYYNRIINRTPEVALTPVIDILQKVKEGAVRQEEAEKIIDRYKGIDSREQYDRFFLGVPVTQQYSISTNGGNNINTFNIGANFTKIVNENGNVGQKINFQFADRLRLGAKVIVDANLYYTNSSSKTGEPAFDSHLFTVRGKSVPYLSFADEAGNPLPFENRYRKAYLDKQNINNILDWDYIPLEDYKYTHDVTRNQELFGTINIGYKIFPFLNLNVGYQAQQQKEVDDLQYGADSWNARELVNRFAQYDSETGSMKFPVPRGGTRHLNSSATSSYTLRGQLDFNKEWKKHLITGLVGVEARQNKTDGNSFTAYGYSNDPLVSIPVNYETQYPIAVEKRTSSISGAPTFSFTLNRFVSTYANVAYLFDKKYGFSGSVRRDGANIFGATTNDKWKPFWSVGGSWTVSNEEFLKIDAIKLLKLRATYGYSGNVDLRRTPLPLANITSSSYANLPVLIIGSLNDPSLQWERVSTINLGLDFSMFNNVLSGNFDYYTKRGRDLYGLSAYDYTIWGYQPFITKNVASMEGTGIDAMISTRNLNKRIKWTTTLFLSYNKNKTKEYYNPSPMNITNFLGSGKEITAVPGLPLHAIAAYKWAGLDEQGNPQGILNGNPSIDYEAIRTEASSAGAIPENIVFKGSSKPQLFGSIQNRIDYKTFSVVANIGFQADYYFLKNTTNYSSLFSQGLAYEDILERWHRPGDESKTNVPSILYPDNNQRNTFYNQSEINVLKADHLRIQFINFTWSPKIRKSFHTEFFCNASNLGILWRANKEKIDPEFQGRIGPLKTYAVGLRITY